MGPKQSGGGKLTTDEKQTKISSFFQNGPSKNIGTSNLFSTINPKSSTVPLKKRAKLSLAGRKNPKDSKAHKENDTDVIILDVSDELSSKKENLQIDKDRIDLIMNFTKDVKGISEKEGEGKEKLQICFNSQSHNSNLNDDSLLRKNQVEQDGIAEACSLSTKGNFPDTSAVRTGHNEKHADEDCQRNSSEKPSDPMPVLSSTPLKCLPGNADTSELDGSDIIFDTPIDEGKKSSFFNRKLLVASENTLSSISDQRRGKVDPSLISEISVQSKASLNYRKDIIDEEKDTHFDTNQSSTEAKVQSISDLQDELNESGLYVLDGGNQCFEKNCEIPFKSSKGIFRENSSGNLIHENLSNKAKGKERDGNIAKPFQHILTRNYCDQAGDKMPRTSSDSKLLNALRESERNSSEKEIQQNLQEKVFWGLDASRCDEPLSALDAQDNLETGKTSSCSRKLNCKLRSRDHPSLPVKVKQASQIESLCQDSDKDFFESGYTDFINMQSKSKQIDSLHTEISGKKSKKSSSKCIEDFKRRRENKHEKKEASLKDDSFLRELMNGLGPSGSSSSKRKPIDSPHPVADGAKTDKTKSPKDQVSLKGSEINKKEIHKKASSVAAASSIEMLFEDSFSDTDLTKLNSKTSFLPGTKQFENGKEAVDAPKGIESMDCGSLENTHLRYKRKLPVSESSLSHSKRRLTGSIESIIPDKERTSENNDKGPSAKSNRGMDNADQELLSYESIVCFSEADEMNVDEMPVVPTEENVIIIDEEDTPERTEATSSNCDTTSSEAVCLNEGNTFSSKTSVEVREPSLSKESMSSQPDIMIVEKLQTSSNSISISSSPLPSTILSTTCNEQSTGIDISKEKAGEESKVRKSSGTLSPEIGNKSVSPSCLQSPMKGIPEECATEALDKKSAIVQSDNSTNLSVHKICNLNEVNTNADDSFDIHDDSLLLAAENDGSSELPLSGHSVTDGGVKSDFCFSHLWNRFVVKTVSEDRRKGEKCLGLTKEKRVTLTHRCILRGFWSETQVREGDLINVLASFENGECIITDASGFIVVNPDVLMSGTTVVSSVFCMRKSVLNEIVKSQDSGNIHMLYGRFLHSLFQSVLKDGVTQKDKIISMAKTIFSSSKFLHEMYSNSISEAKVWGEVNEYMPSLISWVSRHTDFSVASGKGKLKTSSKALDNDLVVTDVQDIEENIWSPRLGLKGKIDLTVKVRSGRDSRTKILPLELKTGKASFSAEHKGQVILYSMMYGDRREEPGEGILLYLKNSEMEKVKVKPQSQSGLIQLRNSMASFLSHLVSQEQSNDGESNFRLGALPEPINNQRGCVKCPHLLTCCMYQKTVEKSSLPERHAMNQLRSETLGHLDEIDLDYFHHWALCLSLEKHKSNKKKLKEIWMQSSKERENRGDCLRSLMIVSSELGIQETQAFTEGQGCSLTFTRHQSYQGPKMDTVGLSCHDSVVVSSEDGRLIALATGFIRNISSDHVEVVVDRDNLSDTSSYTDIIFRLDRNDSFSTHATLLGNVSRLMESTPHGAKMRSLVIKKTPPSFEMKIPMPWVKKIKPIFKDLNKPQKSAILKVLMAKDYVLIRGFPGTGKTSTIVALVKVLSTLGLSVLLTSYTHSAVDNICLKLKKDDIPFLRLGRQSRIHAGIMSHCAEILSTKSKTVQELTDFYASYNIVATSCLGMNHSLFTRRRFDVCIVDEASQILQPACLGPLFNCDKFVLVGDAQQLPPLVQSKEAKLLGMDQSLFTKLEASGATYDLNLQYRMNDTIMAISNLLVYNGKLKCGSQEIAQRCLDIDESLLQNCPVWIHQALNCDLKKSVMFIDTGKTTCSDVQDSKGSRNETEAKIVMELLESLVKADVNCGDIGVISPYRSQVKFLHQMKDAHPSLSGIEVNTVDQYQGRDKRIIIVSFVYTSHNGGGELLRDLRRLNVALTRAQSKLVLVGNATALRSLAHLDSLLDHLRKSDSIICYSDSSNDQRATESADGDSK